MMSGKLTNSRSKCADCDYRYAVGRSPRCTPCKKRRTSDLAHATTIKQKYGITGEEYAAMLADQGGVCYICGGKSGKKRLAVDHDHRTGEVRGLLCKRCNRMLGYYGDKPETFTMAAAYLRDPVSRRVLAERDWTPYIEEKYK